MKELFDFLENAEGGSELLGAVKEKFSGFNSVEAELRTANNKLKQFEGVDIASLQAKAQFVDDKGGIESINSNIAKANGVDDLKEQARIDMEEHEKRETEWNTKYEAMQKELDRSSLENKALTYFADEFNNPDKIMKMVIDEGLIGVGENGLYYQNGDNKKSFSDGGFEELKLNDSYNWALKKPSGGNIGGGANTGNTGNAKGSQSLADQLDAVFGGN